MATIKAYRQIGGNDLPAIKDDPRNLGDLKIETISEGVPGAGVTIDGVKLKDGILPPDNLTSRFSLNWVAGRWGKPGLNADLAGSAQVTQAEMAKILLTDKEFEILGTNASSDDVTINPEGGITFTTDGADKDQIILLPHLDSGQSRWTDWTWGTDQQTEWKATIKTGADITNSIIVAGLKLTNTDVIATDDDQAFFRYENGINSGNWQINTSRAGVDVSADSGVVVAASTVYAFEIKIDAYRVPTFYINGVLVYTGAALVTAKDFIPYISIKADGAAEAKTLDVRGQSISRVYA